MVIKWDLWNPYMPRERRKAISPPRSRRRPGIEYIMPVFAGVERVRANERQDGGDRPRTVHLEAGVVFVGLVFGWPATRRLIAGKDPQGPCPVTLDNRIILLVCTSAPSSPAYLPLRCVIVWAGNLARSLAKEATSLRLRYCKH